MSGFPGPIPPNYWPISTYPSRYNQANTMDIGLPASPPSGVNIIPSSLLPARSVNPWPNFDRSISDLLGNSIRTKPEEKQVKRQLLSSQMQWPKRTIVALLAVLKKLVGRQKWPQNHVGS
jgi:hypothetical protein